MLAKDTKMQHIISNLIPNTSDFDVYQECEAKRHFKSKDSKRKLKEFKKLKAKQVAKGEMHQKQKEKIKIDKEKRRDLKALTKQKEELEKLDYYKNRRK
jgi:hypothetical protein